MINFDQPINRRETNSYKWDVLNQELPMWVADMDFEVAPVIAEAINQKLTPAVFGYQVVPSAFFESIISWWQSRHHFLINQDWLLFCTGVVPAISSIVRKLTRTGDQVVVLSPVYNIFYNSIINNHRTVCQSELIYQNGEYQIDFADLEEKLSNINTSLLIFCNPHNPIGKIWDATSMRRVAELCIKYEVVIISDEIHCDLVFPGKQYIPFASLSDEIANQVITCISASKSFNIAGIQTSALMIKNAKLHQLVERAINTDEIAEPNVFAVEALVAAFTKGEDWLEALRIYLYQNYQYLSDFIVQYLPQLTLVKSEATYLAWIDCQKLTNDATVFCEFLRQQTGLILSTGEMYGSNCKCFVRLNFATTRVQLEDGLQRLKKGVTAFQTASLDNL